MKNRNLYVAPNYETETIIQHKGKPLPKEKAKRNDVPPMYRRNRKQDALDLALIIVSCLGLAVGIMFILTL